MVYLRVAEKSDIDLLFEWTNDPTVRRNSFKSDPISYEDHKRWFEQIMADDMALQYILMEDEVPVGQIRLNIEKGSAEIGYSIAAEYRGKGYGHRILHMIEEEVKKHYPEIKVLIAKVKPENTVSKKLFESENYTLKFSCSSMDVIGAGGYGQINAVPNIDVYERSITS